MENQKKALVEILKRNKAEIIKEDVVTPARRGGDRDRGALGHFLLHVFKLDPAQVKTLDHELTLEQGILQHMLRRRVEGLPTSSSAGTAGTAPAPASASAGTAALAEDSPVAPATS